MPPAIEAARTAPTPRLQPAKPAAPQDDRVGDWATLGFHIGLGVGFVAGIPLMAVDPPAPLLTAAVGGIIGAGLGASAGFVADLF